MNAMQVEAEIKKSQRLRELKIRIKNCCCRYCGGSLKLRRILYGNLSEGRVEIFCTDCDRIEYGVDREIFHVAKHFVQEFDFNMYPDNAGNVRTVQMNTAKVCDIMAWGCKNLGFLAYDGFQVPVDISQGIIGDDVVLRNAELEPEPEIETMDENMIFGRGSGDSTCL
ncbi:MAG: hypothetical protein LBS10_08935 [Gracilibacteraceae bacterium]|jgi:hypothetical protein|nr:hypothetical protein [Gracilibacteraceae bacterium]